MYKRIKKFLKNKIASGSVETAIQVVTTVVLASLIVAGTVGIVDVVLPETENKISSLFSYSANNAAAPTGGPELAEGTTDATVGVRINERINLSSINSGIKAANIRTATYEIKDGTILIFDNPGANIVLPAEKDGNSYNITLVVKNPDYVSSGEDVVASGEKFADAEMRVSPLSGGSYTSNDYRVTVNTYDDGIIYLDGSTQKMEIVPGTLKIKQTSDSKWRDIIYGNDDGCSYDFTVTDPLKFTVHAEYASWDKNTTNTAVIKDTISAVNSGGSYKVRFLVRIPALKAEPGQYNTAYSWWPDYEKAQNGKAIGEYVSYGAFAIPTILLDDAGGKFVPPADFNPQTQDKFSMGKQEVRNIRLSNISQATEKYSDAWFSLTSIPNDMLDIPITMVPYIYYLDEDGVGGFFLGNGFEGSYNDFLNVEG